MVELARGNVLFAYKALSLIPKLSGAARRVAGAILDHYNQRTGRCDPSVKRIARMLGIDRATVLRATKELCEGEVQFFKKRSHGGHSHCASYSPLWDFYSQIVADWKEAMKTGELSFNVAKVSSKASQDCDSERCGNATQTILINPSKKPVPVDGFENTPKTPTIPSPQNQRNKTEREVSPNPQRSMLLPIRGGREPSHAKAAKTAAERRWTAQLMSLDSALLTRVWVELDTAPEIYAAATQAELARPGEGFRYVVSALSEPTACRVADG